MYTSVLCAIVLYDSTIALYRNVLYGSTIAGYSQRYEQFYPLHINAGYWV